ncbi:hypothetical protein HID58_005635, partial [Brassica napus]
LDATKASPFNESYWSDPDYCKHFNARERLGADEKRLYMEPFFCGWSKSSLPLSKVLLEIEYPDFIVGFVHIDDVVSYPTKRKKKYNVVATHELAMEEPKATGRILRNKSPNYPLENKSQISLSCNNKEGDNSPHSMDTRKIHELGFASFKS